MAEVVAVGTVALPLAAALLGLVKTCWDLKQKFADHARNAHDLKKHRSRLDKRLDRISSFCEWFQEKISYANPELDARIKDVISRAQKTIKRIQNKLTCATSPRSQAKLKIETIADWDRDLHEVESNLHALYLVFSMEIFLETKQISLETRQVSLDTRQISLDTRQDLLLIRAELRELIISERRALLREVERLAVMRLQSCNEIYADHKHSCSSTSLDRKREQTADLDGPSATRRRIRNHSPDTPDTSANTCRRVERMRSPATEGSDRGVKTGRSTTQNLQSKPQTNPDSRAVGEVADSGRSPGREVRSRDVLSGRGSSLQSGKFTMPGSFPESSEDVTIIPSSSSSLAGMHGSHTPCTTFIIDCSPDGKLMACGMHSGLVWIYDVPTSALINTILTNADNDETLLTCIAFNRNGEEIVCGLGGPHCSKEHGRTLMPLCIKTFRSRTGENVDSILDINAEYALDYRVQFDWVRYIPGSRKIIAGWHNTMLDDARSKPLSYSGTLVYDPKCRRGKAIEIVPNESRLPLALAVSKSSARLATATATHAVFHDAMAITSGVCLHVEHDQQNTPISSLPVQAAFMPSEELSIWATDNRVYVCDTNRLKRTEEVVLPRSGVTGSWSGRRFGYTLSGQPIFVGFNKSDVWLGAPNLDDTDSSSWTWRRLHSQKAPHSPCELSPDADRLFYALSDDGVVHSWDVRTLLANGANVETRH